MQESKQDAHDAGSSSKPKTIVSQVDVLVAAFVKDPHIQLVAIVSYIRYSINIFYHDHRHVTLSTVNFQMVKQRNVNKVQVHSLQAKIPLCLSGC